MEFEIFLIILGIILSPIYAMLFYLLKKLNFSCVIIAQLVTFAKMVHPEKAKNVFTS